MIYLYHIRKCGGRSLIFSLLWQLGNAPEIYAAICRGETMHAGRKIAGWQPRPDADAYLAWSHVGYDACVIPPGAFTVTVLRDPLARVVSYYGMLRMYEAGASGAASVAPEELQYLRGNNLREFVHALPKERLLRQLFMFSENFDVDQAAGRIRALSHYFRVEDYAAGLARLATKLGVGELEMYRVDDPAKSDAVRQRIADELPAIESELRHMLKLEYELLEAVGNGN